MGQYDIPEPSWFTDEEEWRERHGENIEDDEDEEEYEDED